MDLSDPVGKQRILQGLGYGTNFYLHEMAFMCGIFMSGIFMSGIFMCGIFMSGIFMLEYLCVEDLCSESDQF